MSNYLLTKTKELCCGCEACVQVCPRGCISLKEDAEGFLYPVIEKDHCINCGKCIKVCPITNAVPPNCSEQEVYAVQNTNQEVLARSTSGGAFMAIVDAFCDKDFFVFGAAYDNDFKVVHLPVRDKNEIEKLHGAKYSQSNIGTSYAKAHQYLEMGEKVLFSGTPCQIAGLRSYLAKEYENLFCCDIVCHGVPSPGVFRSYIDYQKKKNGTITGINFRDKSVAGWAKPYMKLNFINGKEIKQDIHNDYYGRGYFRQLFIRPSCHTCRFTTKQRMGDITIADFWGIEDVTIDTTKGVSLLLVNSEKGKKLFKKLTRLVVIKKTFSDAVKKNPNLVRATTANKRRSAFFNYYANNSFNNVIKKYLVEKKRILKRLVNLLRGKK